MKIEAFKALFFFFIVLASTWLPAQTIPCNGCQTYSKLLKKRYRMSQRGSVSISNRFGPVRVEGWDRESVQLEALIEVKAANEAYATQTLDRIQLDFGYSNERLQVKTTIKDKERAWWQWGGAELQDYSISYRLKVPEKIYLSVNNKHGDLRLQSLRGEVEATLSHGNFNAEALLGSTQAKLEHGYARVKEFKALDIQLKDVKFRLEDGKRLKMNSRYSSVNLEDVQEVYSQSRYDNYRLEDIRFFHNQGQYDEIDLKEGREMDIQSLYSEIYAEDIERVIRLDIDDSKVRVVDIDEDFENIDISGNSTIFFFRIEDGADYAIDAIADYAGIRYPQQLRVLHERELGNKHELKAYSGQQHSGGKIRARVSYGALHFEHD